MTNERVDEKDILRQRIEERIKSLESHAELIEDLIQGDPDRHMPGLVQDLKELRQDVSELLQERDKLVQMGEFKDQTEEFMARWDKKETLFKGIGIGMGLLGVESLATIIMNIFGAG